MKIAVVQRDVTCDTAPSAVGFDVVFRRDDPSPAQAEALGRVAVLQGDAALDAEALRSLADGSIEVLVLSPGSESDIQAEGMLEYAIGLSDSVAGLVLVVEDDGAEPGSAGHGGSAIVLLGEVLAETMSGADVIDAEIGVPVPQPVPRDPLPALPTILEQRLAHHQGRHLHHDYPSDG